MPYYFFLGNETNKEHLAEHGVSPEEFEAVVCYPESVDRSRSSARLVAFGEVEGRFLACVYEMMDDDTILPGNCLRG